jgi:regulator of sigma E protease
MLLLKIIIGLAGLGVVVFFHELGHFLAARLVGIDVEAFSIGWGNPIFQKKIGDVEYRIGMFPLGGYCKMKGSSDYGTSDYKEAWEKMKNGEKLEKNSFLGASPQARILVSFAGPFFNLLLAVLLFSIIWGVGFEVNTLGNRIILASEITPGLTYPADEAGFKTGDRIIEIAGHEISYYHEVQENIALNPEKPLPVTVDREGEIVSLNVVPSLDKSSGAGKIGVYFWTDPVIGNIKDGSPAQKAGLMPADIITAANGEEIRNSMDLAKILDENPDNLAIEYRRNGQLMNAQFSGEDLKDELGFSWATISYRTPNLSLPAAVSKGVKESYKTLAVSVKSLRLLFKGIDLTQAVSGPIRITYMMGDMAAQGFGQGFGTGVRSLVDFIALISIALCVMNLLPLPILDGGMIILFLVEFVRRKPAHPRAISIFQTCGIVIIFSLMLFAVFGDIMYFVRR